MVFLVADTGGPKFIAIVFDTTRSYHFAFVPFNACFLASAPLLYLDRPPVPVVSTPSLEASDD